MSAVFPITFNANWLGRSFKEVSSEIVRTTHHQVVRRWLHSENDADLFIWTDMNQRLLKQQFFCFGQVAEWNAVEGVRTGAILFDENRAEDGDSLHFDLTPQRSALAQACSVIACIEILNDSERAQLQANFAPGRSSPLRNDAGVGTQWMERLTRPTNQTSLRKRLVTWIKAWFKL